jgi:hypothetical protein
MPNRLNLEIVQDFSVFVENLEAESAVLRNCREIESAFGAVKVERSYGFRLNLEDQAVLVIPVFEVIFDLTKTIAGARSALLKTTASLTPQFKASRMLLAWTSLMHESKTPFLLDLEPDLERYAWQIVLGSLSSLAKTGAPALVALAEFPDRALAILPDSDLHEYLVAPTASFLAGLKNGASLASLAGGRTIFKHQMHLINNQLKPSLGLKVTT